MEDQQAALDFAYVAVGRVASISKLIVAHYYGKPADHAYFTGCSTGGREAMLMAQRYPSYFDGIVSGAPAMRTGHSNLALRFMATTYNQIAPRDESGKPVTAQALSDRDRKLVLDSFMNTCDADDGLRMACFSTPLVAGFNPEASYAKGRKKRGASLRNRQPPSGRRSPARKIQKEIRSIRDFYAIAAWQPRRASPVCSGVQARRDRRSSLWRCMWMRKRAPPIAIRRQS
jgi:pimeloyl-ACP methyl ester carboxylesterase